MYTNRRWLAVLAVGLSMFLSALDATIVALALPTIAGHLHLSDSVVSTVILSYAIPLTVFVLPAGALTTRWRPMPLFVSAVLGFGLGSLLCGLASSFPVLLLGRALQGSCAAVMATIGFALAAAVVAPSERGRAIGFIGSLAPLGSIAGPGLGGLLLARWDWHAIFFVNVPICVLVAALGVLSLRGVRLDDQQHRAPKGVAHMAAPLRRAPFRWGLLGFLTSTTIASGLYYLLPFDLASVQRVAPATAGLLLLCMPVGMVAVGMLSGFLTDRYGARPLTLLGSGLILASLLLLALVLAHPAAPFDIAWRLALIGMGTGLFTSPNQTQLMSNGPRESLGAASALVNLSARLGPVVGPSLISLLWLALPGLTGQMLAGTLLLVVLSGVTILCAWCATPPPQPTAQQAASHPTQGREPASVER